MQLKLFLLLLVIVAISGVHPELINTKVVKTITFARQLVKIKEDVTIKNSGLNKVGEFVYAIDPDVDDFYVKFKNKHNKELIFHEMDRNNQSNARFKVFLDRKLSFEDKFSLKSDIVYFGRIRPAKKTVTFSEDQFLVYTGNVFYYSPYETLLLQTTYSLQDIENLDLSHSPQHWEGRNLTYSYKNVKSFSFEKVTFEFKDNGPLLVVMHLERSIDVSHFGRICIQDQVAIKNEGSKLVGPYMNNLSNFVTQASNWWYTHLPAAAESVEYFDAIGNNSNSVLLHFNNYKTFKFRPRYPLLSGWKTSYIIKYCVPSFEYLYHDSNRNFVLKIRALDHVLNDIVIKEAVVKVLLPEAAVIVKVKMPSGFHRLGDETSFTGLTTFGRPTVGINGSNLLESHIAYLKVEYVFPLGHLLRVPFVLVLYVQSVFVFFIIVARIKG